MPKEINSTYIELLEACVPQIHHEKATRWANSFKEALGKGTFYKITPDTPFIGMHSGVAYLHHEPEKEIGHSIPMSQIIDETQIENIELSKELVLKEAQIRKLKQILREAYKPRMLKKISIHGSIVSSASLFVSLIYSFNIIHPILAGPLLIVSILLLIMSTGLGKRKKAIA